MSACGMIRMDNGITFPAIWLDGLVGISEKESSGFLAPNPATEYIKVLSGETVLTHEVLTMSGSTVLSGNGGKVHVGPLSTGIYLLRYSTASGIRVKQFAKI
jgi:hypothetical protein